MLKKKRNIRYNFQNGNQSNRHFHVVVTKQCYAKLKAYSETSGYTMTSILETAIDEFFSKPEWEEITSNCIITILDNDNQA